MTDSPAFKAPLDPAEQPILDKLLYTRDKLLLLKQDKTRYVKSQDVISHYDDVIKQVEALNNIRTNKREEQNRVDTVLDDCFQLISLFFFTIGRNSEAPAAYCLVSTIKRLLDHLKEAGFFMNKDLESMSHKLETIHECVEREGANQSPHLTTLLEARMTYCRNMISELQLSLSQLSPELMGYHEKLVSILRCLSACNTKEKCPFSNIKDLRRQLAEVEDEFKGAPQKRLCEEATLKERLNQYTNSIEKMTYTDRAKIPGDEIIADLIERCFLYSEIILQRKGKFDERFRDKFSTLADIRNQLEKRSLTQAWSLRETDLYEYQRKLDRFDEARVNGNFLDAEGKPAEIYEQRTLLYLLRKSYALIYLMLTSSEPVSEALLPVYNQLTTLRKCLTEVKRSGGVNSARELYPYSMKLNSIDNMRQDGKFIVNDDIPEGQASVIELLTECFEMAYDLRNDADARDDDDDEEEPETTDGEKQTIPLGNDPRHNGYDTESSEEDDLDGGVEMKSTGSGAVGVGLSRTVSKDVGPVGSSGAQTSAGATSIGVK
ncbi:MAG: hypothetical protein M1831_006634 [Alyxoria varia]|nr:MAG: hypothetical protein M1831_006634 [Alyxoria varia]